MLHDIDSARVEKVVVGLNPTTSPSLPVSSNTKYRAFQ